METAVIKRTTMMMQLRDIALDVTWSKVAARYFPDKTAGWFYNKMNGRDGNGGEGYFSLSERIQLKNALFDLSERIRNAAQNIEI